MPLSRRYTPEKPPEEDCYFGMDYSAMIPVGIGIASGSLTISTNTVPPVAADADWIKGPVQVRDRAIYCRLSGGKNGVDYLLQWIATDTDGNIWPRTAMCLCSQTS